MKASNQLIKRLKGYQRGFRGRFLLLKNRILTDEEFILWDLSFSVLADWDKKNHSDNYGTFSYTQEEIGFFLGWDKTKVCRRSNKLFKKNFWVKRLDNRILVVGFDITEYLTEITKQKGIVNLQEYISERQLDDVKMKQKIESLQHYSPKENSILQARKVVEMQSPIPKEPLVSSKGNITNTLRTDEEYQKIKEKDIFKSMSIEDMKWIDQNVFE